MEATLPKNATPEFLRGLGLKPGDLVIDEGVFRYGAPDITPVKIIELTDAERRSIPRGLDFILGGATYIVHGEEEDSRFPLIDTFGYCSCEKRGLVSEVARIYNANQNVEDRLRRACFGDYFAKIFKGDLRPHNITPERLQELRVFVTSDIERYKRLREILGEPSAEFLALAKREREVAIAVKKELEALRTTQSK